MELSKAVALAALLLVVLLVAGYTFGETEVQAAKPAAETTRS